MRSQLATVIAILGCAGGCATTGGKASALIAAVTGAATVAGGVKTSDCGFPSNPGKCIENVGMTVTLGLVTGAALLTALVFESLGPPVDALARARAAEAARFGPPGTVPPTLPPAPDPRAVQLTREAYLAANAGHCYLVSMLGAKVQAIDPGYYEQVFASDLKIASCL